LPASTCDATCDVSLRVDHRTVERWQKSAVIWLSSRTELGEGSVPATDRILIVGESFLQPFEVE
jgi:hypothetical protein